MCLCVCVYVCVCLCVCVHASSVLRELVPESVICFLTNHGADAFAGMMLGDSDTPETIWHHAMRQHLMATLNTHMLDFALHLRQDCLAVYDYLPLLSAVRYEQLEGELWCQPFFLRNLVNTELFPEWRIDQPFELLRAVLQACNSLQQAEASEANGKDARMSTEQALAHLGLAAGGAARADVAAVRKAYRTLALRYHPVPPPLFLLLHSCTILCICVCQGKTKQEEKGA